MCSHSTLSLRFVPMWHNRRGNITEIKVRFVPLTMCRRTIYHSIRWYSKPILRVPYFLNSFYFAYVNK